MSSALACFTWNDLVRSVGHEYGLWFTDAEAIGILWEHTGYPGFFRGDPFECATRQLHDLFRSVVPADG